MAALLVPAVFKLVELGSGGQTIYGEDPLLGVSRFEATALTVLCEVIVAGMLMSRALRRDGIAFALCLSGIFCLYHLLLDQVAPSEVCPCLGTAPLWIGFSREASEWMAWGLLTTLAISTLSFLTLSLRSQGK